MTPAFAPLTQGQATAHDYRALGLTLGRHSLALLRAQLLQRHLLPAAVLQRYRDGQLARSCGLVTVCHRPGTGLGLQCRISFEMILNPRPIDAKRILPRAMHARLLHLTR
ncbi:hypothetical protein [Mycetohabitans rhizoxinica]|uniref:hypothetical protein n=1 Tax=Mycetohabitans rhizoxinica TaxID=412963 RepID=UPI0030D0D7ED